MAKIIHRPSQRPYIDRLTQRQTRPKLQPMNQIKIPVEQFRTLAVVYRVDLDGQPFYVGACPFSKLHTLNDARGNSKWRETIRPTDVVTLTVIAMFPALADAEAARDVWIATLRPWANLLGVQRAGGGADGKQIIEPATGDTWSSIKSLASDLGVTRQSVYNHLTGASATLCGRRFTRHTTRSQQAAA